MADKLMEIYESMVKKEKEKVVEDNPTIIDTLQERIVVLEGQVNQLLSSK